MKKAELSQLMTLVDGLSPARTTKIAESSDLFSTGVLDSISIIQLIVAIEKEFGITFDYGHIHIDHFRSPLALLGLLQKEYGL